MLDGSQPTGDGEDGFSPRQSGQSLLDWAFILWVYAGSRFTKGGSRGVFRNGPGDGDTLLLPAGKDGTTLSSHGVVAARQG